MPHSTENKAYNIHEAKTNFSKLVAAAEDGKTTIISRYGKPVARIMPITDGTGKAPRKRNLGAGRGQYTFSQAASEDLDKTVLEAFEESARKPWF